MRKDNCEEDKYTGMYHVDLRFSGETVPMVPFVKEVVENVICGLVKSLDGFDPDAEISIVLKPKG